jgi:transglutaminase-like putative cysteine protease
MDLAPFLARTDFVDVDHASIVARVASLGLDGASAEERALRISEHVRSEIAYQFTAKLVRDEYVASHILAEGRGFCVQKAIVACALGRAAGLPSAIVLCDMRDHTLSPRVLAALGTDVMFHHGIHAFFVGDRWWRVDASLSPDFLARKRVALVPFDVASDALLPATTTSGAPHVEYVAFHGTYADLPFEQMIGAFARGYAGADPTLLATLASRAT